MSDITWRAHQALGSGREFDVIRELVARWGDVAEGIGDDAAVLDIPNGMKLVVSTDATVEHVHFERNWITAAEVGARAAAAALSDLAAMGASARSMLVSFIVPPAWRTELGDVADGIGHVARDAGARIVGGNLSAGEPFSCTITVLGVTAAPVSRRGAAPGDVLMVTGIIGGPGAALSAFRAGDTPGHWPRSRFAAPVPRLREGAWLAAQGVHAMIDISDGIAADAQHLAAASALAAQVEPELLPRHPDVSASEALASGEEYELLVAVPAGMADSLSTAFEARFQLPLTRIGRLVAPPADGGSPEAGSRSRVEFPVGHDHFSL